MSEYIGEYWLIIRNALFSGASLDDGRKGLKPQLIVAIDGECDTFEWTENDPFTVSSSQGR